MTTDTVIHREDIRARYGSQTTVEHKVVFYIDGKKYGFRCADATLDALQVAEGAVIPKLNLDDQSWDAMGLSY